jgi:mRNA interferase HigB
MMVLRTDRLAEFGRKHPDARAPLAAWLQTVSAATWHAPADARETYGSLDPSVPVTSGGRVAVFNIKGNKYRLIASINYPLGILNVLRVMTHAEYTRGAWKDVL